MTTTVQAIRDRLRTVIEAATPRTAPTGDLFRYRPERSLLLQDWVASCPADCFRAFEIRRVGDLADSQGWQPDEIQRNDEQLLLTVAYPYLPDLYGESYEAMEDCMRSDAAQLRDLCISGSTVSAISGWSGTVGCTIHEPERDGDVWFQRLTLTISYCESQTLT